MPGINPCLFFPPPLLPPAGAATIGSFVIRSVESFEVPLLINRLPNTGDTTVTADERLIGEENGAMPGTAEIDQVGIDRHRVVRNLIRLIDPPPINQLHDSLVSKSLNVSSF
ncbi:hypothetical protein [Prosthecobacter sp.]|uniref:hypothetical protein n=1 Tax=Prosthecobacter sp. TaxID=1965333 RepID=UPI0025E879EC|nr:hypothetical protein [Prosthecobacter sp.]